MRIEVLEILRCPEDHTALSLASSGLVGTLNSAIRAERLVNRSGKRVDRVIDGGLVRSAGDVLYPIIDEIPVLLRDEAIELEQISETIG